MVAQGKAEIPSHHLAEPYLKSILEPGLRPSDPEHDPGYLSHVPSYSGGTGRRNQKASGKPVTSGQPGASSKPVKRKAKAAARMYRPPKVRPKF